MAPSRRTKADQKLAREQMIIRHMPLVTFVVGRMSGDGHRTMGLDREDAISYGTEGLIQAVDNFDPTRNQLRELRHPPHPGLDPRRHP